MEKTRLYYNLMAIKTNVDALIQELAAEQTPAKGCPHDRVENQTVMGGDPVYVCLDCGETFEDNEDKVSAKMKKE